MYFNYDIHLRATVRFTGNELKKYASISANIDYLQNQLFTSNRITALQILKNSQTTVEPYFNTVTEFAELRNGVFS